MFKLCRTLIAAALLMTAGAAAPANDAARPSTEIGSATRPASESGSTRTPAASPAPSGKQARIPVLPYRPAAARTTPHAGAAARPGVAELPAGDHQPFGFTGYIKDPESGLYYAGARYYDPATARFTTEDPEAGRDMEPPSLHRYLYAYANPTTYTDPTGRASLDSQRLAYQQSIDLAPNPQARATAEAVMRDYEAHRHEVAMEAAKAGVVSIGLVVGGAYVAEGVAIGRAMYATYAAYGASAALTQHGPAAANYAATGIETVVSVATGANAPSAVPLAAAESAAARVLETDVPVAPAAAAMAKTEFSLAEAAHSSQAMTVVEGHGLESTFVASRQMGTAIPDPRRFLDLSSQFKVSPLRGGTKFEYGNPNGWAEVGNDSHGIIGFVDKDGVLGFDVFANPELRETYGSGQDMFRSMWARIQQENVQVNGIRGVWLKGSDSVNYAQYREGVASGLTPQQAAASTWTGQRAAERGYTDVESVNDRGDVTAIFRAPEHEQ